MFVYNHLVIASLPQSVYSKQAKNMLTMAAVTSFPGTEFWSSDSMPSNKHPLLPGTLNLLILKSIGERGLHGLEIQQRIEMNSGKVFDVEEGSLYPALHRLANDGLIIGEWAVTERGRRGKYYRLTSKGKKQLQREVESWRICSEAIERVLSFT